MFAADLASALTVVRNRSESNTVYVISHIGIYWGPYRIGRPHTVGQRIASEHNEVAECQRIQTGRDYFPLRIVITDEFSELW